MRAIVSARFTLVLAACGVPVVAAADAGSTLEANSGLAEIVVTAQKREQNLQDVGVAVNAYSEATIRELKIETTADVARFTPNMNTRNTMGDTMPVITLRGVGSATNDIQFPNSPPSVAVHLDEVYLGSPTLLMAANFDLERIEVLKGPQGTLYGRNTTAGTVNFISAKPRNEFGGNLSVGYGRYETNGDWFESSGFVTGALTSTLAGRLAFTYKKGDQYTTDLTGRPYDGPDRVAVRGLLSWKPTEQLNVLFNVHGSRDRPGSVAPQIAAVAGANCPYGRTGAVDLVHCSPAAVPKNIILDDGVTVVPFKEPSNPFDTDVYRNGSSTRDRQNLQGQGTSVHADWRLADSVTLTSISAYERADTLIFENFSGRDVPHYYDIRHHDIVDQFSQEMRLSGTANRLYWVAGLYYFRENIDSHLTSYFQSSSIGLGPNGAIPYALPEQYRTLMDTNSLTHSAAAFGQAEFDLTDRIKLIAGMRFTYEEKEYLRAVSYNIPRVPGVDTLVSVGRINPTNGLPALRYLRADSTVPLQADWRNTSWKLGVNYQLVPASMLYGTVSTGFKAGTFSGSTLILPEALARPANPERLMATEMGIKTRLLDGRLRLNAAAFHYDYKDLQITSTIRTSSGDNSSILDNIGKATVNGIDFDAAWQPFGGLTLGLALGYLNGVYKDFISDGLDFSGLHMINAPDLTATARATYQWRTGLGAFTLSSDVAYTSKTDLDFRDNLNSTVDFDRARAQFVVPAHTLLDSRAAWRNVAGDLEVALWGQNLTNKAVLTHTTFGVNEAVLFYGAPRSLGFNVSLSF
jgi:iron complex outermembrane receptor protein